MSRFRTCDACDSRIPAKEVYFAIIERKYDGKNIVQNHVADMCEICFKKLKSKNNVPSIVKLRKDLKERCKLGKHIFMVKDDDDNTHACIHCGFEQPRFEKSK